MKTLGALVLIDFQIGFENPVWGARNNPEAEANAARLLRAWRDAGGPIAHVRHLSAVAGSPLRDAGADWMPLLAPHRHEARFEKSVNSAFIGTGLEAWLRDRNLRALVIAGLTTPHCVSTSCRMAANLGFDVTLAHDACATFAGNADPGWTKGPAPTPEASHAMAVSHLHGEFADARTTADILSA